MNGIGNRFGIGAKFLAIAVVIWVLGELFFSVGYKLANTFGFDKDWVANAAFFVAVLLFAAALVWKNRLD